MSTSTADIRQFLATTFGDEELVTLCFDYFRDVYESFASGMTKRQKIQLLIEHCERRGAIPSLLASLQRARPEQYQERFPPRPGPRAEAQLESPRLERDARQVFISHAHEDAEFAHRLAGDLRERGWRVWIAPESIRPGEKWVEAINRGLEECGVFLIVLTPSAVRSQWVKNETNVAIEFEHEGRMRFVPLELERCSLPPLWRAFQRIPFQVHYETGRQALLAALEGKFTYAEPPPVPNVSAPAERAKPDRPTSSPAVAAPSQPEALASGDLQVPVPKIAGVPDITWADIPAGTLLMGSQRGDTFQTLDGAHEPDDNEYWPEGLPRAIPIQAFRMSAYPITVSQFRPFVQDPEGWAIPGWWTEAGLKNRGGDKAPYAWDDPRWSMGDLPVVGVTWYAAVAYCRWLTARLRAAGARDALVRLPTEAEWEWAARGGSPSVPPASRGEEKGGRRWPWGNDWRKNVCNSREAGLGRTSVVTQFPAGVNWTGNVYDLAGNVWEWCCTKWQDRYDDHYPALEGTDEWTDPYLAGDALRVLRGGSFYFVARFVRGVVRFTLRDYPGFWYPFRGFRCVCASGSSSES